MEKIYKTEETIERFILVGVCTGTESETIDSLDELEELISTAGGKCVARVIQNREKIHPGTYIGTGKIEEVSVLVNELNATGIVCDDELSPNQLNNLESSLNTKILDRTQVILDIFAKRATSKEGKIQVELAQLKYRSARLIGLGTSLSRLGGGIGTRGPGEKKLEIDRRVIKERISILKSEIRDMESHRELVRKKRSKNPIQVISIVGYTNAGKSTLLNSLTEANVLAEDKLFATLDPTTRNLKLESGQEIMFTDTVGFIRKLPHNLIDAFKSTLEEAKFSNIILHVVDASNIQMEDQMKIVYKTLKDLKVEGKTIITLFNKMDKVDREHIFKDPKADYTVYASMKTGEGIDKLLNIIEEILRGGKVHIIEKFKFEEAGKIQLIRKYGELISEEYGEDGINVEGYIPKEFIGKILK